MPRKFFVLVLCIIVGLSLVACGQQTEKNETATDPATQNENAAPATGTTFEGKYVSGQTFSQWSFSEDEKNDIFAWIRHSSNAKFIAFSFVWENTVEPEKYVQDFVDGNKEMNPTKPEKITYGDNEYYKISYENLGYKNIQLVTKKGELLITVNLQGTGVEEDADVPKILETLRYKEIKNN